jgi:hypothetical protein
VIDSFLGALVGALILGATCWVLGWHYGARSLRNRHARLIKVIELYNKDAQQRDKRTGNNWYDGYSRGIADTLSALERFLDKFKE